MAILKREEEAFLFSRYVLLLQQEYVVRGVVNSTGWAGSGGGRARATESVSIGGG